MESLGKEAQPVKLKSLPEPRESFFSELLAEVLTEKSDAAVGSARLSEIRRVYLKCWKPCGRRFSTRSP